MGIFQKLSTLIRSNINDLISRAENPEKMLTQIILDMRDQLGRAKREVAAAIADERKLKQQLEDEVKQARDWEQRAMLAVRENRDDLAKQALMRQQEHAERANTLDHAWRSQAGEIDKLKASLRQLNDKIDEARSGSGTCSSRSRSEPKPSVVSTRPCPGCRTRRPSTRSTGWPRRSRTPSAG